MALAKLSKTDETRATLTDLLKDAHPHFRLSVVGALEELGDPRVRGILARQLGRETDGRVVRRIREAVQRLSTAQPQKEHVDQLLRLEKDLNELKARLVTLEAHKHNPS